MSIYEYTLFCRKCYRKQVVIEREKNQVELACKKCICAMPLVVPPISAKEITPPPVIATVEIKKSKRGN